MAEIYVKLSDVLDLLPTDDIAGPKPTHLRKLLAELDAVIIEDLDEEDDFK